MLTATRKNRGVRLSSWAAHLILAGILGIALLLRAWGLSFGLPYAYHVDEPTYVSAALNLGVGIIGKQPNPTAFSNILFGEYAAYFAAGRALGVFESAAAFEQAYRTDPSAFLLLSRLTSAIIGTATVAVVYWLGKAIDGPIVGFFSAGLLAVAFLHIRDSHFGAPDILATFCVSLTVLLTILGLRRSRLRWIVLAGAAAGFAIAAKWNMLWVVLPVGLGVLWYAAGSLGTRSRWRSYGEAVVPTALGVVAGLFLGGFQLFLEPATYLEYALREARSGAGGGFGYWQIDVVPGWLFYLKTLWYGLGVVMMGLSGMGLVGQSSRAFRNRDRVSCLLLVFPVVYFATMGMTRHYFARYALPLLPFAAVFAANAIREIAQWLSRSDRRVGLGAASILIVATSAQPLAYSIRHDVLLTRTDTRTLAKAWMEQNIPAGARIAVDWPTHGPPLSTPTVSVPASVRSYDVTLVGGMGLSEHSIAWYRERGFDYLIASSFIYQIPLVYPDEDWERRMFYNALAQDLPVMKEFWSTADETDPPFIFDEIYGPVVSLWQRERPGPTLIIYSVK